MRNLLGVKVLSTASVSPASGATVTPKADEGEQTPLTDALAGLPATDLFQPQDNSLPFSFRQLQDSKWYPEDRVDWECLNGASMVEFTIRVALRGSDQLVRATDVLGMVDSLIEEGFLGTYLKEAGLEFDRTWLSAQQNITIDEVFTHGIRKSVHSEGTPLIVGDRVRVSESTVGGWREGVVTSMSNGAPQVRISGVPSSYSWDLVERVSAADNEPTPPYSGSEPPPFESRENVDNMRYSSQV